MSMSMLPIKARQEINIDFKQEVKYKRELCQQISERVKQQSRQIQKRGTKKTEKYQFQQCVLNIANPIHKCNQSPQLINNTYVQNYSRFEHTQSKISKIEVRTVGIRKKVSLRELQLCLYPQTEILDLYVPNQTLNDMKYFVSDIQRYYSLREFILNVTNITNDIFIILAKCMRQFSRLEKINIKTSIQACYKTEFKEEMECTLKELKFLKKIIWMVYPNLIIPQRLDFYDLFKYFNTDLEHLEYCSYKLSKLQFDSILNGLSNFTYLKKLQLYLKTDVNLSLKQMIPVLQSLTQLEELILICMWVFDSQEMQDLSSCVSKLLQLKMIQFEDEVIKIENNELSASSTQQKTSQLEGNFETLRLKKHGSRNKQSTITDKWAFSDLLAFSQVKRLSIAFDNVLFKGYSLISLLNSISHMKNLTYFTLILRFPSANLDDESFCDVLTQTREQMPDLVSFRLELIYAHSKFTNKALQSMGKIFQKFNKLKYLSLYIQDSTLEWDKEGIVSLRSGLIQCKFLEYVYISFYGIKSKNQNFKQLFEIQDCPITFDVIVS